MRISDWSSDVCSSDLCPDTAAGGGGLWRDRHGQWRGGIAAARQCPAADGAGRSADAGSRWHRTAGSHPGPPPEPAGRSEERRVGKSVSVRVDLGVRRIFKKTKNQKMLIINTID